MSGIVCKIQKKTIFCMRLILVGDSVGVMNGNKSLEGNWTEYRYRILGPLKMIDEVKVGYTELGIIFMYVD